MPVDLSNVLVIGVSSTALFDLTEAERIFRDDGIAAYRDYMVKNEAIPFSPGTGFAVVQALLALNQHGQQGKPLVEVLVMSRNSLETSVGIMNSVRHYGLSITRFAFTGGEPLASYVRPLGVDLFLSTSKDDVQRIADAGHCAAAILYPPPPNYLPPKEQVRFAFDADAVLFSEDSELRFKQEGLSAFHAAEAAAADDPMKDGPFAPFLRKLAKLKAALPERVEYAPIRIAIVTARNAPAQSRVITTLREWRVYADEAFFLGGLEKKPVLEAFRPHIFFDDQDLHVRPASVVVPSGLVPYRSNSPLQVEPIALADDGMVVPLTRSPADQSYGNANGVPVGDPVRDEEGAA